MRLFAWQLLGEAKNLWDAPAMLLQKIPAPNFCATTKLTFSPFKKGERAGLEVMGMDYATLSIESGENGLTLKQITCLKADKGSPEIINASLPLVQPVVYLRVEVRQTKILSKDGIYEPIGACSFSYSLNGNDFTKLGETFSAREGLWIGAKVGLYCSRPKPSNDSGYADVDWFRVETVK